MVFADTSYYLALLLANDVAHAKAVQVTRTLSKPVLTTAWVLTELANALSSPVHRPVFVRFAKALGENPGTTVVAPSSALFERGSA